MDRRTLIASLDVLSQNFRDEADPIAKDLRTMAYVVAKMSDEELRNRLAEDVPEVGGQERTAGNPWIDHVKKTKKDNPDLSLKEVITKAKKTYKKEASDEEVKEAEEVLSSQETETEAPEYNDFWTKEAADAVQMALLEDTGLVKEAGKTRGVPDGTGPYGRGMGPGKGRADGTGLEEAAKKEEEKTAGKIKGPGKPDGTGPMSGTPECPMSEEKKEKKEKKAEEQPEKPVEESADKDASGCVEEPEKEEKKKESAEEKESDEKPDEAVVNTDILANVEFEGIEITNPMAMADVEVTDEDKAALGQLFQAAEGQNLSDTEKEKLDQLFR